MLGTGAAYNHGNYTARRQGLASPLSQPADTVCFSMLRMISMTVLYVHI